MAADNFEGFQQQEESIDIKALFFKFVRYWYLFALTVFVAIVVAFLFNKYTSPVYEVNTTVLVKDDKGGALSAASMLGGLGLSNTQQNVENEIGILSSFSLTYRAIRELDFEVSYFIDEGLINTEMYPSAPFEVIMDTSVSQAVGLKFKIKFLDNSKYAIEADGELIRKYNFSTAQYDDGELEKVKIDGEYRFGELVENDYATFKVILTKEFDAKKDFDESYYFLFNDYYGLTGSFMGFEIEPINREASILNIKLKRTILRRLLTF